MAILCDLTEAMVDAALARGDGATSGFDAALERYRDGGAPGVLLAWRRRHLPSAADRRALGVLARLQRDLLLGLAA